MQMNVMEWERRCKGPWKYIKMRKKRKKNQSGQTNGCLMAASRHTTHTMHIDKG